MDEVPIIAINCENLDQRHKLIKALKVLGLEHIKPIATGLEHNIWTGKAFKYSYVVIIEPHGWCVGPKPIRGQVFNINDIVTYE